MRIELNELVVRYSEEEKCLKIFRKISKETEVIHTSYSLDEILNLGVKEAGKMIGEDILLSLGSLASRFTEN